MIKVSRIETDNELKAGIESLTSIFIEEYHITQHGLKKICTNSIVVKSKY